VDEAVDQNLVEKYCRDLSQAQLPGDPPVDDPRADLLRRVIRDVADRKSVVLVGPNGVGKTYLVHTMAGRLLRGDGPVELTGFRVYEASCTALMAGTRYVGEWESKIFNLIRALGPRSILCLSDVWNMLGTGSYRGSPKDLYDSFKTAVEKRDVILVGELTEERLSAVTAREPSFPQVFSLHRLPEPPEAAVRQILDAGARQLARKYRVEVGAQVPDRVYALTRRFIPYETFPGKAVRLLERIFSETAARAGRIVDPQIVWQIFANQTGLPLWILDDSQAMDLDKARSFFTSRILGQEAAIDTVVDTIALYKARLSDPTKPIGIFFFVGPTGVGKTELAKALAAYLFGSPDRMIRLDMSEYVTYDSLEKLLGKRSQSSDVDPTDQGLLTGQVRKLPFSVVLLDEFEKAHSLVYDLMLQVFADGRLTDARGETTDFRNTIIILTSNVGSARLGSEIGFTGRADLNQFEAKVHKEMEAHFRPEFINRLDHVVVFRPLDEETMRRIARLELAKLNELEGMRHLQPILDVDDQAVALLVRSGFDPKFGARPLRRAIKGLITTPLARLLVTKPTAPRQIIRVRSRGDEMILDLESTEASVKASAWEAKLEIDPAGIGRPQRLNVKEVAASLESILGRLERAEEAFGLKEAETLLKELESRRARPDFWNDTAESARVIHRYHRLQGEIKPFKDVREMARFIFESVDLTVREKDPALLKDISREYQRLLRLTEKLELESQIFTDEHRRDAFVTVSAAGVGQEDKRWVEELSAVYERWAVSKGYRFTPLYRTPTGKNDFEIAVKGLVDVRVRLSLRRRGAPPAGAPAGGREEGPDGDRCGASRGVPPLAHGGSAHRAHAAGSPRGSRSHRRSRHPGHARQIAGIRRVAAGKLADRSGEPRTGNVDPEVHARTQSSGWRFGGSKGACSFLRCRSQPGGKGQAHRRFGAQSAQGFRG
jgi:ATP-dependent Clp protease ATP-binding subunit ClpC